MMSGLDLTDVRKGFGGRARSRRRLALGGARRGHIALIGPSGSGKSTLLSLLTGALAPESGRMLFDGAPMTGRARPVAYMPQRDALLPWRRALDNAAVGLEVAGVRRREARQQADALFDTFGLQGTQDRYPRQLSGGMRQRVSLLRTVVQKKPLLLLDEPFGALDAITRDDLQMWLLNIWAVHRWKHSARDPRHPRGHSALRPRARAVEPPRTARRRGAGQSRHPARRPVLRRPAHRAARGSAARHASGRVTPRLSAGSRRATPRRASRSRSTSPMPARPARVCRSPGDPRGTPRGHRD